ncbi:hypothetical protein BA022_04780 [Diaphorobacter nitroreducens]|uniref:hypothetical protein n=1 Tax=Diaphorobacter nitroreducens TaxID=164759 RepID=UPI000B59DB96|nr:hypothetical protein [Diaphorobacter nitroreducens]ASI67949.1 hypothetical protein BA022_04770 [Diaphorobacter nitroreducens]ASI67951.1 hypothetical protein BA022_04780 [Diaphorobacter nitroreducens]
MNTPHEFHPEKIPSDCWDWITREDATRHALAAFEMARRECFPPEGERFLDADLCAWCNRETFADLLADCFSMRIKAMAYGYGFGDFLPEVKRLNLWGQQGNARAPEREDASS